HPVSAGNGARNSGTSPVVRRIGVVPGATLPVDGGCMVGLLSVWLLTQCFLYQALPLFTISMGITLSPDRILFGVVIGAFFVKRAAGKTILMPVSKLEYLMLLFAIAGTISWAMYGADVNVRKFRALTTL